MDTLSFYTVKIFNKVLRFFNVKLIRTTNVFDWMGDEFHLPLTQSKDDKGNLIIVNSNKKQLPLDSRDEAGINFIIRAVHQINHA